MFIEATYWRDLSLHAYQYDRLEKDSCILPSMQNNFPEAIWITILE